MLAGVPEAEFGALPALQRNALEVALLRAAPEGPALDARLVATGLLTLVRGLALRAAVLLALDDVQWLDGPTAGVLTFAIRRLDAEPVGVLCASRPQAAGTGLLDSVESHRVRRVRLGPLALGSLGEVIADRLGRSLPRPILARVAEASRGNPFYALEVARLVIADAEVGAADARLPVPDDVRTLAASRVSELPAATQRALLRAAVLARAHHQGDRCRAARGRRGAGHREDRRTRTHRLRAPAVRRRDLGVGIGRPAAGRPPRRRRAGRRPRAAGPPPRLQRRPGRPRRRRRARCRGRAGRLPGSPRRGRGAHRAGARAHPGARRRTPRRAPAARGRPASRRRRHRAGR